MIQVVISSFLSDNRIHFINYRIDKYKDITTYGPVSQGEFLRAMGIDFRLVELLKKLDENDPRAEQLITGYERLVGTEEGQMGATYKAWAFTSKGATPAGFDTAKTPYDDDL
jgi:SAM-dependent MidA family methyltransferase